MEEKRFYITDIYDEQEGIPTFIWSLCRIKGCPNRACLDLQSKYCFPHTQDKNNLDSLLKGDENGRDKKEIKETERR